MKWIIECGINTANNLGSPPTLQLLLSHPFQKTERKNWRERWERDTEREKRGEGERERKSQLPSGGESCY